MKMSAWLNSLSERRRFRSSGVVPPADMRWVSRRPGCGRWGDPVGGEMVFAFSPSGNTLKGVTCLDASPVNFPSAAMSMITWKTMTKKIREMLKRSHTSTILKYDVFGSDVEVCQG